MKLLSIVASTILVLGLSPSLYADVEYEHAVKTSSSVDSPTQDMSKMKAAGKCGSK
ncbi:hypothetical protein [Sulfurimonas sp. CS5]|jgi:hypothetical protein|uniref:hypothetical protein n=1 Tax=Sulfurimonas sp. CS5 TaxID=3391145 RepID=UPI0039EBCD1E